LIAHHWALADAPGYVAPFAFRAGNYAARLAAWSEAIAFYTQALAAEADDLRRTDIFLALGNAYWNRGDLSQASNAFRSAVELAQRHQDWARLEEAHLSLNRSFYTQGRYAEAIAVAQELRQTCPPDLTLAAEFMWGMALSLQSTHPIEAEFHLREAEKLLTAPRSFPSQLTPATLKYQLAGALGQQGKLAEAIALYRQALALVNENENALDLQRRILLYNSLAYYLHLGNDPAAIEYARAGLELARENGSLTHQAYLLSTLGEIELAQNNWASAQTCFADGLRIAEQLNIPERIAGLTANLGRAEILRGNATRARELLQDALHRADQIGASHLAVRIRIWLAPLLALSERAQRLSEAHALAEASGYARLLDEIAQLEQAHT
jgi:tetratricopeptide (TPR) repeat protein